MMKNSRLGVGVALAAAMAISQGCKTDVINPGIIDAEFFDPGADATTVSLSAQTRFWNGYSTLVLWSAYFSGELWTGAARIETNDVARRVINSASLDVAPPWNSIQAALASNELAIQVLAKGTNAAADVNLARAYMNSGFALTLLGETFCEGIILSGPPLTPAQVQDTAIARFKQAIAIGAAAAAASPTPATSEGTKIVNASNVGLARVYLQKKDYANAATTAALVPANFTYNAIRLDDPSQPGLRNIVYVNAILGTDVVIAGAYRALNDPRVPWVDAGRNATDGQIRLFRPNKYTAGANPIRIASTLEATYIVAEAKLLTGDPAPALALIAARRTAGGQPAFTGTGTAAILAELMDQRARDFWIEGKHTGDWRRNPEATPYVSASGTPFFKPAQGNYGTASCLPVPDAERNANPNYPKG